MANGEQTTYDPRMGPLDGSQMLLEHLARMQSGQTNPFVNAMPKPRPQPSDNQFQANMLRPLLGSPRPQGTAKQAIAQAVQAGRASMGGVPPQTPQQPSTPDPMDALRGLIQQQTPSGLGGMLGAQGTSTISLANMIASGGRSPVVGPNDVMRAQRQQAIANIGGLITMETEIKKNGTAQDRLNFDKLKLAFERGDKRAAAVMNAVKLIGENLTGVDDRGTRALGAFAKLSRALDELPRGSGLPAIVSVAGRIAAEAATGATAGDNSTAVAKLQKERDKAVAENRFDDAKQLNARIAKLTTITGTTEFDPGTDEASIRKGREKLQDAQSNGLDTLDLIERMKTQLGDADTLTSFVGGATSFVNSLSAQIKQGSSVLGFNDQEAIDSASESPSVRAAIVNGFGKEAAQSAQFKSNAIRLAYAIARSQQGGRLSDRDFISALDQIAAGAGDKAVTARVLDEVAANTRSSIRNQFSTARDFIGEENVPQLNERFAGDGASPVAVPTAPASGPVPDFIWTPEGGVQPNPDKR